MLQDFSEDFMIVDETGKTLSATSMLPLLLRYHVNSCHRYIAPNRFSLVESDVTWIIITASTWTKSAIDLVTAAAAKVTYSDPPVHY